MIEFYRNNFNFKDTYDKFVSILDYLEKNKNPIEIEKLGFFSMPTDISDFIPLLTKMYKNHILVNQAVSKIFNIENYSDHKLDDVSTAIVGKNYLIFNRIIFFINPLSIEAQSIADSIKDYDINEILFDKIGIILEEQIREVSNKINVDAIKKKVNLKELSIEKIFQDLMKMAIELKATKIKLFVEDNFVKANFFVESFYIKKKEVVLTGVNNFQDIKTMLSSQFINSSLDWKYNTSFYKIVLDSESNNDFLYMDIYNLSEKTKTINDIPLKDKDIKILMNAIRSPSGVVVISGSDNSGKRSLMYSLLTYLRDDNDGLNIVTYEKEIKNKVYGITQKNGESINESELGHYSVVAIDQNSNLETIKDSFKIASKGKLVILVVDSSSIFNTLSMINTAISDKEYILENILTVMHTGLLNSICTSCSTDIQFSKVRDSHLFISLENSPKLTDIIKEEHKDGCDECNYGFKDRIPVTEIVENDLILKDLFVKGFNISNYKTEKRSKSWNSNFESAMKLLADRKTSLNSIIKVFGYYKK